MAGRIRTEGQEGALTADWTGSARCTPRLLRAAWRPVHDELQILEYGLGFREVVIRSTGGGQFDQNGR
jgi:hypothetical protein